MRRRAAVALLAGATSGLALAAGAAELAEVGRIAVPADVQVRFALISPDGRQLTAACGDRQLRAWSLPALAGASPLRTIVLDGEPVTRLGYSHDGTWLAASTRKGLVGVFRAETGESVARIQTAVPGRDAEITGLALAPDGSRVAIAPANAPAELWEVAGGGRQRAVLTTTFGGSNALDFSPDGTRLASADEDTAIRFYDAEGRLRATSDDFLLESFALGFSADGATLAVAGPDKTVTLVDPVSGRAHRGLPRQQDPISWLAALRRGGTIVTGSFKEKSMAIPGPVLAWSLDGKAPRVIATDRRFVGGGALDDGRLLLATLEAGALVIWAVQ